MPVQRSELQRAFNRYLRQRDNDELIPALMGKQTGAATYTYDVPGGRGLKYVRILQGNVATSIVQAVNEAGIADTGDLPIWIKQVEGARYAIVKARFNA